MASLADYFSTIYKNTEAFENEGGRRKLKSDANAGDPNKAWRKRLNKQQCLSITPLDPKTPIREDHVRFVCISDTHTKLEQFKCMEIPPGDVLLHAGDFSMFGMPDEIDVVNTYLGTLPHKYKVIIAGNHDNTFDLELMNNRRSTRIWSMTEDNYESRMKSYGVNTVHEMLTDCIYLQDSAVEIYGIKIYGSPWTPGHGTWGFQALRGPNLMKKWNAIPRDIDVLVTHCPPCGYGDNVNTTISSKLKRLAGFAEEHVGCVDLLNTVQTRVKPKYHIYGHIHEGYGVRTDGTTTFINASTCTESYDPSNPPVVFDVPIPDGYSKESKNKTHQKDVDVCNNHKTMTNNCDKDIVILKNFNNQDEFDTDLACSTNLEVNIDYVDGFNSEINGSGYLKTIQENDDDLFSSCSSHTNGDTTSDISKDNNDNDDDDDDEDSDIVFGVSEVDAVVESGDGYSSTGNGNRYKAVFDDISMIETKTENKNNIDHSEYVLSFDKC